MTAAEDNDLQRRVWHELDRAVGDRLHPWRTPVLATVDDDGLPNARTVVLRKVDRAKRQLSVYTDERSPKVAQLKSSGRAVLVFWNKASGWQLRIACRASVITCGEELDTAWENIVGTAAAADYLSLSAPGSPITVASNGMGNAHHLAIIKLAVESIDWLELNERGHRRARLTADSLEWLVP